MPTSHAQLARNARLYHWYTAASQAYAWLPVFFLFFQEKLPVERVLQLEAIYFATVCLFEVPSGYLSDRAGRRVTLCVAALAVASAHGVFFLASFGDDVFLPYCAGQALLALGQAFLSGTDTALHLETLQQLGCAEQYAAREARAARFGFASSACAALAGGAAADYALRYAYLLSWVAALCALTLTLLLVEPAGGAAARSDGGPTEAGSLRGFGRQLARCLRLLRDRRLRWLSAFAVFMVVINHVPYELYQPYVAALDGAGTSGLPQRAPLLLGVHTFLTMGVASAVAARSAGVAQRLGTPATLLLGAALQLAMVTAMAATLHWAVAALLILRSCPRALTTAPLNAAVTPRVPGELRATYLSAQSLGGRLTFAALLAALPGAARLVWSDDTASGWDQLSHILWLCAGLGLLAAAALIWTRAHARPPATAHAQRRT